MEKERILEKSRNENEKGDEREKSISQQANENAYWAIMIVYLLLGIASNIQEWITGNSFANYRVFMLAFFVGFFGKMLTQYFYTKKNYYLFIAIAAIVLCILDIYAIIVGI
ncbi:MAG: DUF6442 family protein [Lachnospiraceae bacterium]